MFGKYCKIGVLALLLLPVCGYAQATEGALAGTPESVLPDVAELLKKLGPDGRRQFLFRLLYYRYYNYDLDQPFLPQYQENQRQLIAALRKEV